MSAKRKFSKEHIENLRKAHKGQVSWRKGKRFISLEKQKEKRKISLTAWKLKNRDKLLKQGRESYQRNIHNRRKFSRKFYWTNREKELDRIRFKKYGINGDEFRVLVEKQKGKCPICEKTDKKNLSVDHCHITGKIRGIICNKCNMALGNVEDSPKILKALANYLEKYVSKRP